MAKVTVNGGICGFEATIHANMNEDEMVEMQFCTNCPNFKRFETQWTEFDPFDSLGRYGTGELIEEITAACPHKACPFPTALYKAIEVAGGLALPADVTIKVEK